jgi:protein involved in polysaccharide export with SLBB domain
MKTNKILTSKNINKSNFIILFHLILIVGQFSFGQNFQNIGLNNQDKLIRLPEAFIIETQIDPETYILGPGDKIGLSIITSSNMAYILTIIPSGALWIPDIGPIHISGNNIPDAEIKVAKYIHENRFKTADISLVLLNIRQFKIQVIGAVNSPGFINVSSIERLTDAIRKLGGLHKLADEDNISIQRVNSGEFNCSLKSYQLNGDLANNPILKEGDVIRVAYNSEYSEELKASITHKQSLVFVTGFVLRPSGHKFLPGYTVNDYIAISGGVTDFGSLKNLSINRNGELLAIESINYLEPGDEINIPGNMKYRLLGNMSVLQTITAMMTLYLTYQAAIN